MGSSRDNAHVWNEISDYVYGYMRPRANSLYIADNIFNFISFKENPYILIKIALKFVQKDPIDNKAALVQVMAWHQATAWTNP